VERVTGIEPAFSAWEADVLPLNYTRADAAMLAKALLSGANARRAGTLGQHRDPGVTSA
jgi:hypothetical protein